MSRSRRRRSRPRRQLHGLTTSNGGRGTTFTVLAACSSQSQEIRGSGASPKQQHLPVKRSADVHNVGRVEFRRNRLVRNDDDPERELLRSRSAPISFEHEECRLVRGDPYEEIIRRLSAPSRAKSVRQPSRGGQALLRPCATFMSGRRL